MLPDKARAVTIYESTGNLSPDLEMSLPSQASAAVSILRKGYNPIPRLAERGLPNRIEENDWRKIAGERDEENNQPEEDRHRMGRL
jgi:hypothetical protein